MSKTFSLLCGLPGSGKSTYAKKLQEVYGLDKTIIIESDSYRERLYGSPEIQGDNNKLFDVIHKDVLSSLASGMNVIFDATNIARKHRVALTQKLGTDVVKECIVIATSYSSCLENNNNRSRVVPKVVIDRMWKSFQIPTYTEGFDVIDIEYNYDKESYNIEEYLSFADNYDQANPHHSMTLGGHSRKVAEYVSESKVDEWFRLASLLHDCGKPMSQVFTNMKGEPSEIGHYYGHENCGAYEALFYLDEKIIRLNDLINAVTLINYHMRPYMTKTDKAKNKLKETVGEDLYYFLEILHEADKKAH